MPVFNNILAGAAGQAGGAAAAAGPIKSVRFNSADSANLTKTFSTHSTTFTISFWFKRTNVGAGAVYNHIFTSTGNDNGTSYYFGVTTVNDILYIYQNGHNTSTGRLVRDPSAWYHVVVSVNSGTGTLYVNNEEVQQVTGCKYGGTAHIGNWAGGSYYTDGYLADAYLIDGQALSPTDFGAYDDNNVWQATKYSGTFGTNGFHLFDFANESGIGDDSSGNDNDWTVNNFVASSNNWANYVYAGGATYSSTETGKAFWTGTGDDLFDGTTDNYVGGENVDGGTLYFRPETAITGVTSIELYGAYNGETRVNGSVVTVSPSWSTSDQYVSVQSPPSSITEISVKGDTSYQASARLKAIKVNGSMLTDSPAEDVDVLRDVPTNGSTDDDTGAGGEVSGNYCVFNALDTSWTLSNGNLDAVAPSSPNQSLCPGTIFVNSGKWYAEITLPNNSTSTRGMVGVHKLGADQDGILGKNSGDGAGYIPSHDTARVNGTETASFFGQTYTSNNIVVGIALDLDDGTVDIYVNGTLAGELATGLSGYYTFAACDQYTTGAPNAVLNAGQRAFAYSAPSGFKALCTTNLPTPDVPDGSAYFDTKLYDGTGAAQTISGLSFSPDLVWLKRRSSPAESHTLFDTVRGAGKELIADSTSAEYDAGTGSSGSLIAFNSDGFNLGTRSSVNGSSTTNVAWTWDAGSSTVSNTDGDITSSVRANPSAGFSIVKWTSIAWTGSAANRQVGHGLGAAPAFIITKGIDSAAGWYTYHKDVDATNPNDYYLTLNTTDARGSLADSFGPNIPDSTTFGDRLLGFSAGQEAIAYCFAPVAGYSAFGSYTAGGTNEPFLYLGFRPRFILYKYSNTTGSWAIFDTERNPYNVADKYLLANSSATETTLAVWDILSNGLKPRTALPTGNTVIYAAFAENPFQANGGLAR